MSTKASHIIEWLEKLIDEKIRLESINTKRDELLKRNVSKDLIHSGIEESKKKITQAKAELANLLQQWEQK